jgi:hypothetical protein
MNVLCSAEYDFVVTDICNDELQALPNLCESFIPKEVSEG